MPTLHIEHPVTGYDAWRAAFDRFADARREAGVLQARVAVVVDDPRYVMVGLDFAERAQAEAFLRFLESRVWAAREASPALVGRPRTAILDDA